MPEGNEAATLSVMKRKSKKTVKGQNDIDKNTGGDVRKNNRIININTQCPKEKSISPERHSSARETDQQTTACWNEVTHPQRSSPDPRKLNTNRPSHKPHKKPVQAET